MALEQNERYLSAHISDLCRKSAGSGVPRFSSFLNEREAMIAGEAARTERSCPVFYGGYDGATRVVCGFFENTYAEEFDEVAKKRSPKTTSFPCAPLRFRSEAATSSLIVTFSVQFWVSG